MPVKASPKSYRIRVQAKLDRVSFDWLIATAAENNVTVSEYVRAIIIDAKNEPQPITND